MDMIQAAASYPEAFLFNVFLCSGTAFEAELLVSPPRSECLLLCNVCRSAAHHGS